MHDPFSLANIQKTDTKRVYRTYERWPSLARAGFSVGYELPRRGFRKAYVLGMGGSAAGGDIIASWLYDRPDVEFAVFKGHVPVSDMKDSLAIACSASGETKETVEMMKTAVERGATVVSTSSGGTLMEVSKRLLLPHIGMPELVAPRYMLPFIVFTCLSVVNKGLGLRCEGEADDALVELEAESRQVGISCPTSKNPSKRLALSLLKKTPIVYGAGPTWGAGVRFKDVLNENAKKHALFDALPDAFHNGVEAWGNPSRQFAPVFLRHTAEAKSDCTRADAMLSILSRRGINPHEVRGRGRSSLAQLMTMVYRLDMVSYYVAIGLGRDPFPTKLIDKLKVDS